MGGYDVHRGWINFLAAQPDFRENGYGQKLMNSVETVIRKMDCPKINLQISTGNDKILIFYQNLVLPTIIQSVWKNGCKPIIPKIPYKLQS